MGYKRRFEVQISEVKRLGGRWLRTRYPHDGLYKS